MESSDRTAQISHKIEGIFIGLLVRLSCNVEEAIDPSLALLAVMKPVMPHMIVTLIA
jgi:hypothetical protein